MSRTMEALEDAMDACRTMAGWTDSAVRAYDYQQAEAALSALKEALEEVKVIGGVARYPRLARLLSDEEPPADAGPTGGEESDGA